MTDNVITNAQPILFWIIAGLTAGSAIATVLTQNIVRAATWLLFSLGGTSAIFFLLGADFVAATQLLVYVGGTLILVVFGVMLTAQGPFVTMKTGAAEWGVAVAAGIGLLTVLIISISLRFGDFPAERQELREQLPPVVKKYAPKDVDGNLSTEPADAQSTDVLGVGLLGKGVGPAHEEQGKIVRTSYLLPFEIVSVHLLVVLIGAAYLARAKRSQTVQAKDDSTKGAQGS
ncbi:MAG: NADH-quinone oxidoreductase subunit J [Gemmataceae bacterium]